MEYSFTNAYTNSVIFGDDYLIQQIKAFADSDARVTAVHMRVEYVRPICGFYCIKIASSETPSILKRNGVSLESVDGYNIGNSDYVAPEVSLIQDLDEIVVIDKEPYRLTQAGLVRVKLSEAAEFSWEKEHRERVNYGELPFD